MSKDEEILILHPGSRRPSSADDILSLDTVAEATISIEPWVITHPDGSTETVVMKVRGMGAKAELNAYLASIGEDGKKSEERYMLEVFRRTILEPKFSDEQLVSLSEMNAYIIRLLLQFVLNLGYLPASMVHKYAISLTGKSPSENGGKKPPRRPRTRAGSGG